MKATKAVIRQRVEEVMKLRLLGAEFHDVRQYAAEEDADTGRPWNVSERQLWRYIAASDKLLDKYLEKDKAKLFNRHVAQRRALFARAMEAGDWRAALAVVRDEAEMLGLYSPMKIAPTTPDGAKPYQPLDIKRRLAEATAEELEELAAIQQRIEARLNGDNHGRADCPLAVSRNGAAQPGVNGFAGEHDPGTEHPG